MVAGNSASCGAGLAAVGAFSRKTHGSAGDFDIDLPLFGNPGIECRTGPSGNHKVVVTFPVPITGVGNATVTPGTGGSASVSGSPTINGSLRLLLTTTYCCKLDGLILVTPFDSLKAVAQSMYPWAPIAPFFNHELDAAGALRQNGVPVAIIAAQRDEIVPAERTEALRAMVPNLVFDQTIERAGHNDVYTRSEFHEAMRDALARLET